MDCTAAEDARDAKRARLTPSAGDYDDADLISGLDDDVLLRVLGLVADARDAVRTGALSRRWLRLWTRVPALRFASQPEFTAAGGAEEQRAALERYSVFVDGVLARRARSGSAIESVSIVYTPASDEDNDLERQRMPPSFVDAAQLGIPFPPYSEAVHDLLEQLMPASDNAAQGWIGCAFKHGVKSFDLDLRLPLVPPNIWRECYDDYVDEHGGEKGNGRKKPVVLLDEIPDPLRLETMRSALGGSRLRLPTAMKFASLMDLSLEKIRIAAGGAHLLGRLVSSANCPHLQKLRMSKIYLQAFYEEMRVEADVLSELWMEEVKVLMSLKLRTPRLRVLRIYKCTHEILTISAPRLEELAICRPGYPPMWLDVDGGLPCVRSLKLCLWSHRSHLSSYLEAENDTNILLLKHCSSLTCLQVILHGPMRHDYGASVASLLTRFGNLRHLSLHLPFFYGLHYDLHAGLDLLCHHRYHWKSNDISMDHLQEVELAGLTGTDCELWFMITVLASARRLCKVAISFNPYCWQHQGKLDAFERMLIDEGMSVSCRGTHICLQVLGN